MALSFASLTSCEKVFGIKPSKEVTTEVRAVSGFNSIDIDGALDVEITYAPGTESCSVKANSNLQEYILTEVNSGTLKIKRKENVRILPGETIYIYVTASQLNHLDLSGASSAKFSNQLTENTVKLVLSGASELEGTLGVNTLEIDASGASELNLAGTIGGGTVKLSGASELEDYDCAFQNLNIDLSGASAAQLTVNGTLNVKASGASALKYKGNALIGDMDVSGGSEVNKQ